MEIFLFNRKLMWAVVPLIFWSILVLFGALDSTGDESGGMGVRIERRGVRLPGRLVSVVEDSKGNLAVTLEVRRAEDGYALGTDGNELQSLPEGLTVDYIVRGADSPRERPRISLNSGENEPLEFLRGHLRVLMAEKFVVRMSRQGVQVLPKGPQFDQRRFMQELMQRKGAGPPPDDRPMRFPEEMERIPPRYGRGGPPPEGGRGNGTGPGMDQRQLPPETGR